MVSHTYNFYYAEFYRCASFVGRVGGVQKLTTSVKCELGNVIHELGHAIGLWHEHSRRDRDNYIQIIEENIVNQQFSKNFGILSEAISARFEDIPYDIGSIMHYGPTSFSVSAEKKTICPLENATWTNCDDPEEMGQRQGISVKDVLRVRHLYGCGTSK